MNPTLQTFAQRLKHCREAIKISQAELARRIDCHHSIIGKYERDAAKPTIDVVKRLAKVLNTTSGFLLGETEQSNLFRDPQMLKRLEELEALPDPDKQCVLYALDAMLRDFKARKAYMG